jgi:hypothetical protein
MVKYGQSSLQEKFACSYALRFKKNRKEKAKNTLSVGLGRARKGVLSGQMQELGMAQHGQLTMLRYSGDCVIILACDLHIVFVNHIRNGLNKTEVL